MATTATASRALLAAALSMTLLTATLPSASCTRGLSPRGGVGGGGDDDDKDKGEPAPVITTTTAALHPSSSSSFPHFKNSVTGNATKNTTADAHEAREAKAEIRSLFAGKVAPNLLASLLLVMTAGTMAGLTVGLLGMDPLELEVAKESGGTEEERVQATAVWSVVARHHWLLCTLLLINAAANEALPLCLNELAPPVAVILISVTLVLIFGEILPSAVFTGPRRLRLAAAMVPAVRCLMFVTAPISWPQVMGPLTTTQS